MSAAGFLLALVAATSAGSYVVARRVLGLASRGMRPALVRLLEYVGLVAVFYAANLALGLLAVAVLRRVTGGFVSAYLVGDSTLVTHSALQAALQQWWGAETPYAPNERPRSRA